MALTRKLLKSLGLEEAAIDTIIDAHAETVDALKKERDGYKEAADKVDSLIKERDEALQKLGNAGDAAKVQAEFDAYKKQIADEKTYAQKQQAYIDLLKKSGILRESTQKLILKATDLSKEEMGENGFTNETALLESIKTNYGEYIATTETRGVPTVNPPSGGSGAAAKMTKEEIMAIKDPAVRQAEIAKNPGAFGLVFNR